MTKYLLYFSLAITCFRANAQFEHIWAFGKTAGGLNFNATPPVPLETHIFGYGEGSASVCDANGQLLFYTEGSMVWDRNHNLMPNGIHLIDISASPTAENTTSSTTQGALIIPFPDDSLKYYIFSLSSFESDKDKDLDTMGRLYYSVVDMSLNSGNGDIVPNQKGVLLDSLLTEKMTAVTGNYQEVWLLTCSQPPDAKIKAYKITPTGISPPIISGPALVYDKDQWAGCMTVSPDRRKLAVAHCNSVLGGSNDNPGLILFDFDSETGQVANPVQLRNGGAYGVAFSGGGEKLYTSVRAPLPQQGSEIFQYDISLPDPAQVIASSVSLGAAANTHLKRAPDEKIYFNGATAGTLGSINLPDLSGVQADFSSLTVDLSSIANFSGGLGLPNVVPVAKYRTIRDTVCFTPEHILTVPDNSRHVQWNDGSTGNQKVITTSGLYWVEYMTMPAVWHVDSFEIQLQGFPGAFPDIYVQTDCSGKSSGKAWIAIDQPSAPTFTYTWYDEGGSILSTSDSLLNVPGGDYRLRIANAFCDTLLPVTIPEEYLSLSVEPSATLLCLSDTLYLENRSITDEDPTYTWSYGDGTQVNAFNPPPHTYALPGRYRLTVVASSSVCQDSLSLAVQVDAPGENTGFQVSTHEVCQGQAVIFTAESKQDSTIRTIHWSFNTDYRKELDQKAEVQHAFDNAGRFPVTMTTEFRACPDTSYTDSITVYPLPEVDLGSDSSICLHGSPVFLKNRRPAPLNPHHYLWNTGDTTASLKVVHPGTYTLSVTAEPIGCTTTESITIRKDCYVDIPNAFSPNGDGHNDYFFPQQQLSERISRFHMQVFNRWGQLLFETTHPSGRGWDGKFNGQAQPVGVYLYRIKADFADGRQETYSGNVTLIR